MAMFLSGVSDIIIQRIGRWEIFAFLEYIREQVKNFTYGMSSKMLQNDHRNDRNLGRARSIDKNTPTYSEEPNPPFLLQTKKKKR